jgi:hypothetical protein
VKISELPTSVNHVWFQVIDDVIRDVLPTLDRNNIEISRKIRHPVADAIGGLVGEMRRYADRQSFTKVSQMAYN